MHLSRAGNGDRAVPLSSRLIAGLAFAACMECEALHGTGNLFTPLEHFTHRSGSLRTLTARPIYSGKLYGDE